MWSNRDAVFHEGLVRAGDRERRYISAAVSMIWPLAQVFGHPSKRAQPEPRVGLYARGGILLGHMAIRPALVIDGLRIANA